MYSANKWRPTKRIVTVMLQNDKGLVVPYANDALNGVLTILWHAEQNNSVLVSCLCNQVKSDTLNAMLLSAMFVKR